MPAASVAPADPPASSIESIGSTTSSNFLQLPSGSVLGLDTPGGILLEHPLEETCHASTENTVRKA